MAFTTINNANWVRPQTFAEYLALFPSHHAGWLSRRYSPAINDFEDVAQHLLVRTLVTQRVEKYDPSMRGGRDTVGNFVGWMNTCFLNDFLALMIQRKAHARRANYNSISIDSFGQRGSDTTVAEETTDLLAIGSESYRRQTDAIAKQIIDRARINQFREFLLKHRPDMLPAIDRVLEGRREGRTSGYDEDRVTLRRLVKHMERGTIPGGSLWLRNVKKVRKQKNSRQKRYYRLHAEKIKRDKAARYLRNRDAILARSAENYRKRKAKKSTIAAISEGS